MQTDPVIRPAAERAVWSVEISLTQREDGRYVARTSFDGEAGWETCEADDPATALAHATRVAQRRLVEQAGQRW
jgi:hypothetical protein